MKRAFEREEAKEATVIPILLRPVNIKSKFLRNLLSRQALPKDLKPVTQWGDADNAWLSIEEELEQVILSHLDRLSERHLK